MLLRSIVKKGLASVFDVGKNSNYTKREIYLHSAPIRDCIYIHYNTNLTPLSAHSFMIKHTMYAHVSSLSSGNVISDY